MKIRTFALITGLVAGSAQAQLAQNLFIDTKAMSLGNAVTADPVGIMDIHFNPAGLTKLDGRQVQIALMNIMLSAEATFNLPQGYQESEAGLLRIHEDKILGKGCNNSDDAGGYAACSPVTSSATAAAYLPGVGILPMTMPVLTLPSGGLSIQPEGSRFTFANAVYMPMAAGFAKEDDDPGRYQAKLVALQRFTYFSPSFGYKVSDTLSLGAAFLMSHQAVAVKQDVRAPSVLIGVLGELQNAFGCFDANGNPTGNDPLSPIVTLCGGKIGPYEDVGELAMTTEQSLSPSFNLGLLWEPTHWFALGIGYQGEAKTKLKGTFEMDYTDDFANFFAYFRSSIVGAISSTMFSLPTGVKKESGNLSSELTYPQHLRIGTKFRMFDRLQLNVDAGWTDFSKWESLSFEFDRQVGFLSAAKTTAPGIVTDTSLTMPMNYKSVWSMAYGLQYDWNSRLHLRMGYEPRQSSIPDDMRSVQAPLGYADMYSLGFGYQWDRDTVIDFSLSFLQSEENIWADPQSASNNYEFPTSSNGINRNCLTCSVTNPYPGLDVKTKMTIGAMGFTFRSKF